MNSRLKEAIEKIRDVTDEGTWIGRCYVPASQAYKGIPGPHVVQVKNEGVYDLSPYYQSTSELINENNPEGILGSLPELKKLGGLAEILYSSIYSECDSNACHFLEPTDMQAIKACGVTFIQSLLERVIEEKAKGDPSEASKIRKLVTDKIGTDLKDIVPGSDHATCLKKELQEHGIWSQYLEVGIGKDAEIFTKAQPFAAVGFGAEIGVLVDSSWNNPEPEVVLVVSSKGNIVGATLGNDVNHRDYEGRSALLLGEAKDQNGSCVIGPFFRLFDPTFGLDAVKNERINLRILGKDGFELSSTSFMDKISRPPEVLVQQAIGDNHQYPDGLVLFCGTMFAPTKDRDVVGNGFTHKLGDEVIISSDHLGVLINWVNYCNQIPKWEFGIGSFIEFAVKRKK